MNEEADFIEKWGGPEHWACICLIIKSFANIFLLEKLEDFEKPVRLRHGDVFEATPPTFSPSFILKVVKNIASLKEFDPLEKKPGQGKSDILSFSLFRVLKMFLASLKTRHFHADNVKYFFLVTVDFETCQVKGYWKTREEQRNKYAIYFPNREEILNWLEWDDCYPEKEFVIPYGYGLTTKVAMIYRKNLMRPKKYH